MSMVTQAFIVQKYGLRLDSKQIAELMGISVPALYNQISAGTCSLKTYIEGGKRWAHYTHAAEYLEAMAELAS